MIVTGWPPVWSLGPAATHQISENDTPAFRRKAITLADRRPGLRTVRPEFGQVLAVLAGGRGGRL